jgi:peroxin-1
MYAIVSQEILVDRAVHTAAYRFLLPSNASHNSLKRTLLMEDFSKAMHGFLPVAMRDLRKYAPDDKDGGWEDVGGLDEAVTIIKEVDISCFLVLRVLVSSTHMEKIRHLFFLV